MHIRVSVYVYLFLFCSVYLTAGCLTLCFSSIQAAYTVQQPATVCTDQCSADKHTVIARRRHLHVHTVESGLRQLHLQRRLRQCAARPHRLLPHTSWYAGSFIEGYNVGAARRFPKHVADDVSTSMCVLVLVCDCFLWFVLLSIPYSWLPNSLFLLDTGSLICPTTSCRPCQRTFLPGFHRSSECACFAWLSTEILCLS
jgi:hypothetical protein